MLKYFLVMLVLLIGMIGLLNDVVRVCGMLSTFIRVVVLHQVRKIFLSTWTSGQHWTTGRA